ncbi:MAG: 50S ribosomal protein L7Ae [Candidatus Woesearchaeota archaeon]
MDLNQDVPKEIANKALEAVETARNTGKIKKGVNEVTKIIERGLAKLVVVAKDVNPQEIIMHFPALCKEKEVPFVVVPNRSDLGASAGLQVATSAVVVVNEGDAKSLISGIVKKLTV